MKRLPARALMRPVPPRWWQPDGGSIADVFGLFLPILGFALAALWWAVAE